MCGDYDFREKLKGHDWLARLKLGFRITNISLFLIFFESIVHLNNAFKKDSTQNGELSSDILVAIARRTKTSYESKSPSVAPHQIASPPAPPDL